MSSALPKMRSLRCLQKLALKKFNLVLESLSGLFCHIKSDNVIFGNTKYFANTWFQKLLRASTYGKIAHETAPGSIMKTADFLESYKIKEGVRSGGDIAWKMQIKNSLNYYLPKKSYLTYSCLPTSLSSTLKYFFLVFSYPFCKLCN